MKKYLTLNHEKFILNYHLIFSTKYRRKILTSIKKDLFASFHRAEGVAQKKWKIEYVEADNEHVHFFISATPVISIEEIVHSLKQISTYDMWKLHHDYLKRYYWKEHFLWTQGYFVSSVGEVSSERLKEYILDQG